MRFSSLGVLAALLMAVGCGGGNSDTASCDALIKGLNDFNTKAAPCGVNTPPISVTADSCKASIGKCTDADKTKLNNFGSCLSSLPTCSQSTVETWANQVQTCVNNVSGLSSGCGS